MEELNPSTIYYRKKHGIPLDLPLYKCSPKSGNRRKLQSGQPILCLITKAKGRPEKCFARNCKSYKSCLDFAVENNWKGWRIVEGEL